MIKIEFSTGNNAFSDYDYEIKHVIRRIQEKCTKHDYNFVIRDTNGNTIGTCKEV